MMAGAGQEDSCDSTAADLTFSDPVAVVEISPDKLDELQGDNQPYFNYLLRIVDLANTHPAINSSDLPRLFSDVDIDIQGQQENRKVKTRRRGEKLMLSLTLSRPRRT
jgi:hypothetical protein